MKFKDGIIKPGMVIHCPKEEDARTLLEYLDAEGYIWDDTFDRLTDNTRYDEGDTYFLDYIQGEDITSLRVTHDSRDWAIENGYTPTEFSDLIEPDDSPVNSDTDSPMTAVEVLDWLRIYDETDEAEDIFDGYSNISEILKKLTTSEILQKITAYEATKKVSKPIEVEWVDRVKIIQIDHDMKLCVYEEDLKSSTPFIDDPDLKEQAETILKKYASEHEGEFFAVIENVCRVKEGK